MSDRRLNFNKNFKSNILIITLLLITVIPVGAKDFSIGGEIGAAFPMGRFRDNSEIYSKCNTIIYGVNPKIKISDTFMSPGVCYNFNIAYDFFKNFSLHFGAGGNSNKNKGIDVISYSGDFTHPNDSSLVNPYFNSLNLNLELDYTFLRFSNFSLKVGIAPQMSLISYNKFAAGFYPAVPVPIWGVIESQDNKTAYGLSAVVGAGYDLSKDLKIEMNFKYSKIFFDYNSEVISAAYLCYPLDDYYTNPQWLIFGLGLRYKIF